ncbi:MAG: hypothetical protein ACREHD_20175 [Pirellulales bacterium]
MAALLRLADPAASSTGPIVPYRVDFACSNAIELLLAKARSDGGAPAEQSVLEQQVGAFRNLVAELRGLYLSGSRGGEVEKFELARINLALAEARLAHARGDKNAERHALQGALPMAKHLREAIYACYEMGTIRGIDVLYADERATGLETAYALTIGDAALKRRVSQAHLERIDRLWRKRVALSLYSVGGGHQDEVWIACLLRCLLAIQRIEAEGRAAFDDPLSSFAPRLETPDDSRCRRSATGTGFRSYGFGYWSIQRWRSVYGTGANGLIVGKPSSRAMWH